MDPNTITQQLATLKAQAAQVNADINTAPSREIKRLKTAEYMTISAKIAELKNSKAQFQATALETKEENKKTAIKLASLFFPKEQRVQYFATNLNILELMLLLEEVFESEVPAVTAFFYAPADHVGSIPPDWFELVKNEEGD